VPGEPLGNLRKLCQVAPFVLRNTEVMADHPSHLGRAREIHRSREIGSDTLQQRIVRQRDRVSVARSTHHDANQRFAGRGTVFIDARFPQRAEDPYALVSWHEEAEPVQPALRPNRRFIVSKARDHHGRGSNRSEEAAQHRIVVAEDSRGLERRSCQHDGVRVKRLERGRDGKPPRQYCATCRALRHESEDRRRSLDHRTECARQRIGEFRHARDK